ncbi:hypothetical protein DSC45_16955 [Streptomyces sp. YIM 130001]|uniref:DUF6545 domain-containing protein n=1 Tax=Streptomyces sp. YIM 130001 TaxID=2259644 RepID=UPI000E64DA00|nr:DUF6545 domain-containing protein [Streptomyces sp. YIM 130001]RII15932.1 hypothetical protein DSC45_16955 [Streptomyces sp. YIM 130001]
MENGLVFYIPTAVLLLACGLKFATLHGEWRDPLVTAGVTMLMAGAIACFLAAPPTVRAVNDATGISNFSGPLVYSGMSALSASYLVLMLYWQGGRPERLRRRVQWVVGAYALVIVGIVVLFALADVPVERVRDLDTYYANTPFMRETILLYLIGHSVASTTLTVVGLRWIRKLRGPARVGLILIVGGFAFDVVFLAAKFSALAARWSGHDWDWLSTAFAPPMALLAGICVGTGFALPRIGPAIGETFLAWQRCRQLRPLCAELDGLGAPITAVVRWWDPPTVRLAQQEVLIGDGVIACAPYFDQEVRRTAHAEARAAGVGPAVQRPEAVAEAAMLTAARIRVTAPHEADPPAEVGRLTSLASTARMAELARALSSPIVARARAEAAERTAAERATGRSGTPR